MAQLGKWLSIIDKFVASTQTSNKMSTLFPLICLYHPFLFKGLPGPAGLPAIVSVNSVQNAASRTMVSTSRTFYTAESRSPHFSSSFSTIWIPRCLDAAAARKPFSHWPIRFATSCQREHKVATEIADKEHYCDLNWIIYWFQERVAETEQTDHLERRYYHISVLCHPPCPHKNNCMAYIYTYTEYQQSPDWCLKGYI